MSDQFTMSITWFLLLMVLFNGCSSHGASTNISTRPEKVYVGAMLAYSSIVGKVAKLALEAAVADVNSDPSVLKGTEMVVTMQNSNFSGFLGIIEALRFMEKDTVAIIGPQNAVTAHVITHIANELQTPLLSFTVTDPTLSALQFPYFVRTTQNDLFQIAAIADMVDHYGWKEVIAIYVDDEYGRNGITALGDTLAEKRAKISYKAPLVLDPTRNNITDVLVKVSLTESRIIVLHVYSGWGTDVFSVAKYLGMMGTGFVWIATHWLSTYIDTTIPLPMSTMDNMQGVLTLRMYTPDTEQKRKFVSRWSNLTGGSQMGLNAYCLYAYDTVWLLARALDAFFDQGGSISFSNNSRLAQMRKGELNLDSLSVFDEGSLLLRNIFGVNMNGTTGAVKFTADRNLIHPAFEIINVIGSGVRRIGYWSNQSGLSVEPPETIYTVPPNRSSSKQSLPPVIWPGETITKPRGWVFPNNGRHLKIEVPNRASFREFISYTNSNDMYPGYCIDVFTAALNLLPYAVPYKFFPIGDGKRNPQITELVHSVQTGEYDAVVGDVAIITNRTKMADFTQPYIESGLVVVAPVKTTLNSSPWAFLRPFNRMMWIVTAAFFLIVGTVVWILEHRHNDEFRGPPKKQVITILWHKRGLFEALEKLKAELMILGFISLILTFSQDYIANICIPVKVANTMLPCKETTSHRRLLSTERRFLAAATNSTCKSENGYEPLISINGLHQLHILIFFLAAFHVAYSVITMLLGRLKIRGWKQWEAETSSHSYEFSNDPSRFRLTHETSFLKAHTSYWTKIPFFFYVGCFFRQFFRSVSKSDYLTMRNGFIAVHLAPGSKFNFQKYIKRSLEDDFQVVVGVSPVLWASFVIYLLLNVNGWQALFWASMIPVIIILAIGTELQSVLTKIALEISERHAVVQGIPLVQGADRYFWFGRPHLVLHLIHFALFQNAFQIIYFLWIWYSFGLTSCFHANFKLAIAKVIVGGGVLCVCSYITLPLYALVTQMGSNMKKSIFDEQTSKALKKWHNAVKKKTSGQGGKSPARTLGGSTVGGISSVSTIHSSGPTLHRFKTTGHSTRSSAFEDHETSDNETDPLSPGSSTTLMVRVDQVEQQTERTEPHHEEQTTIEMDEFTFTKPGLAKQT